MGEWGREGGRGGGLDFIFLLRVFVVGGCRVG